MSEQLPGGEGRDFREFRISRVDGRGKILDITDPEPQPFVFDPKSGGFAPKFIVNYVRYNTETNKAEVCHSHWINPGTLRLLAWDILTTKKGEPGERGYKPILDEYKGGKPSTKGVEIPDGILVSRRFTVTYNDQLDKGVAYSFGFVVCEGVKGDKGQVTPLRGGASFLKEQVHIPLAEARRFASEVIQYLDAKLSAAITLAWLSPSDDPQSDEPRV